MYDCGDLFGEEMKNNLAFTYCGNSMQKSYFSNTNMSPCFFATIPLSFISRIFP